MKKIFLPVLLIFIFISLHSYDTGKRPLKAMFYSLILPGGGQYYNKSLPKFVFVLTTETTLLGLTSYHTYISEKYYNKSKENLSSDDYQNYLKYYYKKQNDLWWLGSVVILSMLDAYVDAHLADFDSQKNKIHLKFENKMLKIEIKF